MENTVLLCGLAATVCSTISWLAAEKYFKHISLLETKVELEKQNAFLNRHEFEDLFQKNPHPELFDAEGNLDRGEYFVINFPEDFDPATEKWFIEDPDDDEMGW
ncbi:hypothetical protein SCREM2_gp188 [Synechococcus phage S-CREM2]|nr:hypothetical protein SCREM2_gp188 [Synechococcus phage S-CREM2]